MVFVHRRERGGKKNLSSIVLGHWGRGCLPVFMVVQEQQQTHFWLKRRSFCGLDFAELRFGKETIGRWS